MSARTQDEIVARIDATREVDWLGFRLEVLVDALDFDHARPFLREDATATSWPGPSSDFEIESSARSYLDFAVRKIREHRGISADRSVQKLTEWAWLTGRDDVVAAMDAADYAQYGAPQVKAFAVGMGWDWPDKPELERMASGLPCRPGCEDGCGQ